MNSFFSSTIIEWQQKHFNIVPLLQRTVPTPDMADIFIDMITVANNPDTFEHYYSAQTLEGKRTLLRVAFELRLEPQRVLPALESLVTQTASRFWAPVSESFIDYLQYALEQYGDILSELSKNSYFWNAAEYPHKKSLITHLSTDSFIRHADVLGYIDDDSFITHDPYKDLLLMYLSPNMKRLIIMMSHYYQNKYLVYNTICVSQIDDDSMKYFMEEAQITESDRALWDTERALFDTQSLDGFKSYIQYCRTNVTLLHDEITLMVN